MAQDPAEPNAMVGGQQPWRRGVLPVPPEYYGWVAMGAGALGVVLTSPGQSYTLSVFVNHFLDDLALTRSGPSALFTLGTLVAGLVLPFAGRYMDREGSRRVAGLSTIALGLGCLFMAVAANVPMLALGLIVLRTSGQGTLQLASRSLINRWWVRRRARIVGIVGVAVGLGIHSLRVEPPSRPDLADAPSPIDPEGDIDFGGGPVMG